MAQTYANIGINGNSNTAIQKAKKLVESELMRYAKYAIYYESLVEEGLEDRMSQSDLAVVQQLIPAFFEVYRKVDANGVNGLIAKFKNVKVGNKSISSQLMDFLTMSLDERDKQMQQQFSVKQLSSRLQASSHARLPINRAFAPR